MGRKPVALRICNEECECASSMILCACTMLNSSFLHRKKGSKLCFPPSVVTDKQAVKRLNDESCRSEGCTLVVASNYYSNIKKPIAALKLSHGVPPQRHRSTKNEHTSRKPDDMCVCKFRFEMLPERQMHHCNC